MRSGQGSRLHHTYRLKQYEYSKKLQGIYCPATSYVKTIIVLSTDNDWIIRIEVLYFDMCRQLV